jgi:hypothetical protein
MLYHWGLVTVAANAKAPQTEHKPTAVLLPTLIPGLKGLETTKCDLGTHFALALTGMILFVLCDFNIYFDLPHLVEGRVFSWGSGKRGRLGHGSERDESSPKEITSFQSAGSPILDVCAGSWHAMALTQMGEVRFGTSSVPLRIYNSLHI